MTFIILTALTIILAGATFLSILPYDVWWIRSLDFPRLQFAFAILLLLGAQLILLNLSEFRSWAFISVNFLSLSYQTWWILPFTKLKSPEVTTSSSANTDGRNALRIITANVLTTNKNFSGFMSIIKENNPHIFVTLESNRQWQEHLDKLSSYPHAVKCPKDNLYGMHVYSKLPLEQTAIEYLVEPDIPSIHAKAVLPSGQRVQMHFLHPAPPFPTEADQSTERDAELLVAGKAAAKNKDPVVITGDLNDVAWSETTRLFRKTSGLLDPRVGRGMFNTFHADYWFLRWPLDYFFHSSHFTLSALKRLRPFGSDHFAILIELNYEPEKQVEQSSISADKDDEERASEKIEAAD